MLRDRSVDAEHELSQAPSHPASDELRPSGHPHHRLAEMIGVLVLITASVGSATHCQTAHACQIDFYWSRRVSPARLPVQLTPGSQQSGLAALTGALVAARTGS